LRKGLKNWILVGSHLNPDIVEEKIVPNDLEKKMALGLDRAVDHLETLLGEPIDKDVLAIIDGGSLDQAVEPHNKFCPWVCGEMLLDGG
jgi:hypothetical protein